MHAKQLNNKISTLITYTRHEPSSSQPLDLILFLLVITLRINYYKTPSFAAFILNKYLFIYLFFSDLTKDLFIKQQ